MINGHDTYRSGCEPPSGLEYLDRVPEEQQWAALKHVGLIRIFNYAIKDTVQSPHRDSVRKLFIRLNLRVCANLFNSFGEDRHMYHEFIAGLREKFEMSSKKIVLVDGRLSDEHPDNSRIFVPYKRFIFRKLLEEIKTNLAHSRKQDLILMNMDFEVDRLTKFMRSLREKYPKCRVALVNVRIAPQIQRKGYHAHYPVTRNLGREPAIHETPAGVTLEQQLHLETYLSIYRAMDDASPSLTEDEIFVLNEYRTHIFDVSLTSSADPTAADQQLYARNAIVAFKELTEELIRKRHPEISDPETFPLDKCRRCVLREIIALIEMMKLDLQSAGILYEKEENRCPIPPPCPEPRDRVDKSAPTYGGAQFEHAAQPFSYLDAPLGEYNDYGSGEPGSYHNGMSTTNHEYDPYAYGAAPPAHARPLSYHHAPFGEYNNYGSEYNKGIIMTNNEYDPFAYGAAPPAHGKPLSSNQKPPLAPGSYNPSLESSESGELHRPIDTKNMADANKSKPVVNNQDNRKGNPTPKPVAQTK